MESDDPALSPYLRRMLRYGRDCGSGRVLRALRVLQQSAAGLDAALRQADLIALPTVPSPAYAWADGAPANQAELTALANYGGRPAISVPVATGADGRPIGLQLIGRPGADWLVLDAAARIEALAGLRWQSSCQTELLIPSNCIFRLESIPSGTE